MEACSAAPYSKINVTYPDSAQHWGEEEEESLQLTVASFVASSLKGHSLQSVTLICKKINKLIMYIIFIMVSPS